MAVHEQSRVVATPTVIAPPVAGSDCALGESVAWQRSPDGLVSSETLVEPQEAAKHASITAMSVDATRRNG